MLVFNTCSKADRSQLCLTHITSSTDYREHRRTFFPVREFHLICAQSALLISIQIIRPDLDLNLDPCCATVQSQNTSCEKPSWQGLSVRHIWMCRLLRVLVSTLLLVQPVISYGWILLRSTRVSMWMLWTVPCWNARQDADNVRHSGTLITVLCYMYYSLSK